MRAPGNPFAIASLILTLSLAEPAVGQRKGARGELGFASECWVRVVPWPNLLLGLCCSKVHVSLHKGEAGRGTSHCCPQWEREILDLEDLGA